MEWWLVLLETFVIILVIILYQLKRKNVMVISVICLVSVFTLFLMVYWDEFPDTWWNGGMIFLYVWLLLDVTGYFLHLAPKWYFNDMIILVNAVVVFLASFGLAINRSKFWKKTSSSGETLSELAEQSTRGAFIPHDQVRPNEILVVFKSNIQFQRMPTDISKPLNAETVRYFNEFSTLKHVLVTFGKEMKLENIFLDQKESTLNIVKEPWDDLWEQGSYSVQTAEMIPLNTIWKKFYGNLELTDEYQRKLFILQK